MPGLQGYFNPRTPRGVRHDLQRQYGVDIWDFNPRTPRGVRLGVMRATEWCGKFQSTHPARGATGSTVPPPLLYSNFNPRTPRGVRPSVTASPIKWTMVFQSTHPARGATDAPTPPHPCEGDFNPRTPRGVRLWWCFICRVQQQFQSTHPARGATANFTKEQRVCLAQFAYLHKGKKAEHTKTNAPMLH